MQYSLEVVDFKDDGKRIHVKASDCSLVQYWANKYKAEEKVAWVPKKGGPPRLYEPDEVVSPASGLERGDTVWVVPSSTLGAFRDASLIRRLVFSASTEEYSQVRQSLSNAGYPDDVLDIVSFPG